VSVPVAARPEAPVRVLALAGSARRASLNKRLVAVAAAVARDAGAAVTLLDLDDFAMPVYHGDEEAADGLPPAARRLRDHFIAHDALLIASPENNASVPAALKNALDWLSRPHDGQNGLVPYRGKVAALLSASPGALGGLRGLQHLRAILQSLGVLVLTEQFALSRAHEAFDAEGGLADARARASVEGVVRRLVDVAARLRD
jgi:NAD(P)H-dependent FMN reductase